MLGPSSGGKSVLMKVLTGRLPTVHYTGEVRKACGGGYIQTGVVKALPCDTDLDSVVVATRTKRAKRVGSQAACACAPASVFLTRGAGAMCPLSTHTK